MTPVNRNILIPQSVFLQKKTCILFYTMLSSYLVSGKQTNAGMAELADAYGSGPYDSNIMRVQVSFPARQDTSQCDVSFFVS